MLLVYCFVLCVAFIGRFQWAPTLGGECYNAADTADDIELELFQWAPTLGGECYSDAAP